MPEPKPLKSTLNLPQTAFPMKAGLPVNEPLRLAAWEKSDLYAQIRAARAGSPRYILHDGPPYANGAIHLGHALNKTLKDFVVKTKTMAGFDAPYVPGWDCHGLPIEIKVDEQLGRKKKLEMDPARRPPRLPQSTRRSTSTCSAPSVHPYGHLRPLGRALLHHGPRLRGPHRRGPSSHFFENGFVYKGPQARLLVHPTTRTALAEAEVEYEMHTSPSVYVALPEDKRTGCPTSRF